jgi:FdhD protein
MSQASVSLFSIVKSTSESTKSVDDLVAVEEPLEIVVEYGPLEQRRSVNLAITMRTPGHDLELVTGFLATEQLVSQPDQIVAIRHCRSQLNQIQDNRVKVQLDPMIKFRPGKSLRNFYINSSCGVCGKSSVESVMASCEPPIPGQGPQVMESVVKNLPDTLRARQLIFNHTGGLHGACLFDHQGQALWWREDVGRHNAVDKVLGTCFSINRWPLSDYILLVSGRISFELVQKALRAGIRFMAAVGAPSSLAIRLAKNADMTLLGFVNQHRFNIYCGAERVIESVEV